MLENKLFNFYKKTIERLYFKTFPERRLVHLPDKENLQIDYVKYDSVKLQTVREFDNHGITEDFVKTITINELLDGIKPYINIICKKHKNVNRDVIKYEVKAFIHVSEIKKTDGNKSTS